MYLFHILPKKNVGHLVPLQLKDIASKLCISRYKQTLYYMIYRVKKYAFLVMFHLYYYYLRKEKHVTDTQTRVVCDLTFHVVHTKLLGTSENSVKDAAKQKTTKKATSYFNTEKKLIC